jgi:hypothetical protein
LAIVYPEVLTRLERIFEINKWPQNPDEEPDLFDNFCDLLSKLDSEEQELLFILTTDFLRCPFIDYIPLLKKALGNYFLKWCDRFNNIFLIPLSSPADTQRGQVKSGANVVYIAKSLLSKAYPWLKHKRIIDLSEPSKLNEFYPDREKSLIIFMDDFIGSGTTASSILTNYTNDYQVENDEVLIVTLVALETGVKVIKSKGINVLTAYIQRRGISDSNKFADIERALSIMDNIEKRLNIRKSDRRGFKKSEALVALIRTPNNTFPIYWCTETIGGGSWPAPFPR